MGLFDFFKKDKKEELKVTNINIDLTKQDLVKKINLSKEQVKIS